MCEMHELPLAKTWVPCSACNGLVQGQLLSEAVEFCGHGIYWLDVFVNVSKCSHLGKGGVAGMRSYTASDIYVLEFFLPTSNRWGDNSQTSLSLILGTMEENFRTFKLASGQELRDLLSVEVLDFQNGLKLHSVEKIQAKGRGVMLPPGHLDQPPMDDISNETNVVSEAQKYNLPSLEPLQSGKVTTQLYSSDQLSMDHSKNARNVDVTAERNIIMVTSSDEGGPRETQERQHKNTGVRIEVSLDDILKYSKKSRNDAAKKLQVSVSTLKRVCRGYGIQRWPPRNIKKFRSFRPSPVENKGQTEQCLNSNLPSNQASVSVAHTKPAFQDADIVTIRAKYENNTIKLWLSLPSRLVALQQEVAKRLNLKAGTYYVRYKDEENELILIACDEDLQDCIHTFKSSGNTSVVVLLELK
ncbi:hypothetical protein RHMOL_Rhmol02G0310000 [Rhododendron molle]|uniref:Uncharacterized protein n=1 Tax=Rhododendron molle TaxID=49168 RepID=A0ACC0PW99_RHOML|nr:hypothetical protein RHMOL_Rhmol02G0310000 [Rhododendron molle]